MNVKLSIVIAIIALVSCSMDVNGQPYAPSASAQDQLEDLVYNVGDLSREICLKIANTYKRKALCNDFDNIVETVLDHDQDRMLPFLSTSENEFWETAMTQPYKGHLYGFLSDATKLYFFSKNATRVDKYLRKEFFAWLLETALKKPGFGKDPKEKKGGMPGGMGGMGGMFGGGGGQIPKDFNTENLPPNIRAAVEAKIKEQHGETTSMYSYDPDNYTPPDLPKENEGEEAGSDDEGAKGKDEL